MTNKQVISINMRNAADEGNDNEILMITAGKLGHWSFREKVLNKTRKNTEN